jgi:hypothetical protein
MTLLISNNMQCKQPPSARRPQPAPLDRWLNRQQRTGPLQGHFCRVGVDLSPPHGFVAGAVRRAEPRHSGAVNSSLILSAEDMASGEAKVGERLGAGGRRPETAARP